MSYFIWSYILKIYWQGFKQMCNSTSSRLYDQNTFYKACLHDLERTHSFVVIESPFMTRKRMNMLFPILSKLHTKGVYIIINTEPFIEHELS
jgi:hypothetical protein